MNIKLLLCSNSHYDTISPPYPPPQRRLRSFSKCYPNNRVEFWHVSCIMLLTTLQCHMSCNMLHPTFRCWHVTYIFVLACVIYYFATHISVFVCVIRLVATHITVFTCGMYYFATNISALACVIYFVATHPDVDKKLYEEIKTALGDRKMDGTNMKDLM